MFLPSLSFLVLFALYAFNSVLLNVKIIAGLIVLLIVTNVFWQNRIVSKTMGIVFLLGSCYMMLALLDDVFDGEASMGYWFGFFLILFYIAMSILLIIGISKKA